MSTSYAGTYRIVYIGINRYLEIKINGKFVRIEEPIPQFIKGSYAAANYFKV